MEEMNKVGIFIVLFITLIVGISLLSTTADQVSLADQTYTITNESITFSNATAQSLAHHWVTTVSSVLVYNTTNEIILTDAQYTVGSSNTETEATILNTNNTLTAQGYVLANVTYVYQDDNYIRGSPASITIIKLLVLFFAIAILAICVWGLSKTGIMEQFK